MALTNCSALTARITLAVILACAAALRFYHLETPSLWWDEILVPLTSRMSLDYIFDFCRFSEMHPPLFYLVSKAALGIGAGDFSLRLLPAVLGVGSVWLLYRVARAFTDEDTALLAAAVLAVNGLHLLLSREIRPYALLLVLLLMAWKLLTDLAEEGRWRDLVLLCLLNAALFCLHYFSFHLVFAQGAALAAMLLARTGRVDFRRLAVFCAATLVAALPVFIWFFLPSSGSRSIFSLAQYSRMDVLALVADYLGQALYFFDSTPARAATLALAVAGLGLLASRKPKLAVMALILLAVPLANLVAMGKAAYFSPWHVAYATPLLALFTGAALARLPWPKAVAAGVALGGTVLILSSQHSRYYEVDSYRHNVFVTLFKPMARTLAGMLHPGEVVVCSNPGFANGVGWYLDQYTAANPLRTQSVRPGADPLTLRFVSAFNDFGGLGDMSAFLAKTGQPARVDKAQNAMVYTFRVERESAPRLERLPFEASLDAGLKAGPAGFYGRVASLEGVVYSPMPGVGVTASANAVPGVLEYAVENAGSNVPARFFVNLRYLNDGRGNMLALYCRFDDEERIPLAGSPGPDSKRQAQAVFSREKPFKRLTFIVEMLSGDKTAQYHGGNLETLAFRGLDVFACPEGETASCQAAWERRNMESMRLNFGSQSFMVKGPAGQRPSWDTAANLADEPSGEVSGWNVLGPKDEARPAVLTVDLEPGKGVLFYPRLSGPGDSVLVFEVGQGGKDRPVFMMTGVPDEWTPISAQYPLQLEPGPDRRTLRIEIRGRYGQLWHKGGNIFFHGYTR